MKAYFVIRADVEQTRHNHRPKQLQQIHLDISQRSGTRVAAALFSSLSLTRSLQQHFNMIHWWEKVSQKRNAATFPAGARCPMLSEPLMWSSYLFRSRRCCHFSFWILYLCDFYTFHHDCGYRCNWYHRDLNLMSSSGILANFSYFKIQCLLAFTDAF